MRIQDRDHPVDRHDYHLVRRVVWGILIFFWILSRINHQNQKQLPVFFYALILTFFLRGKKRRAVVFLQRDFRTVAIQKRFF